MRCLIPLWAFGGSLLILAVGAFVMQMGVQGAWGIIPAHLNELSPDAVRGLMPGFAYQLGILFAAPVNNVVYALRKPLGYPWALAAFEIANIAILMTVIALGSERKGKSFLSARCHPEEEESFAARGHPTKDLCIAGRSQRQKLRQICRSLSAGLEPIRRVGDGMHRPSLAFVCFADERLLSG